jgi:hypothetical protein
MIGTAVNFAVSTVQTCSSLVQTGRGMYQIEPKLLDVFQKMFREACLPEGAQEGDDVGVASQPTMNEDATKATTTKPKRSKEDILTRAQVSSNEIL